MDEHEDMDGERDQSLAALILREACGPLMVVGPEEDDLWPAFGAVSRDVFLQGGEEVEACARVLEGLGCTVQIVPEGTAPRDGVCFASLLVFGFPRNTSAEESLDVLLSRVVDGGFVFVDVEPEGKAQALRLRRILEASLNDVSVDDGNGSHERILLAGFRRDRGVELEVAVSAEPLPMTVMVHVDELHQDVEECVAALLFRQLEAPALVIFLDDAGGDGCLPADLWGMAPHSRSQPVILRTGGVGPLPALKEGLPHALGDFVVFMDTRCRPAPRWCELMFNNLSQCAGADFLHVPALRDNQMDPVVPCALAMEPQVVGRALAAALLASEDLPPLGSLLMRRTLVESLLKDPALNECESPADLLFLFGLEGGAGVYLDCPLLFGFWDDGSFSRRSLQVLQQRNRCDVLVESLSALPEDQRESIALELRADALLGAGAVREAVVDYEGALALEPGLPELRVALLNALRHTGDTRAMLDRGAAWLNESDQEPLLLLVLAWAFLREGDITGAERCLETCRSLGEELVPWSELPSAGSDAGTLTREIENILEAELGPLATS